MASTYSTQVTYNLVKCPDKLDEIYTWFNEYAALADSAGLAYDGGLAILTIVNCTGAPPPVAECVQTSEQT